MDENRIKHSLEVANKMMKIGKEKKRIFLISN